MHIAVILTLWKARASCKTRNSLVHSYTVLVSSETSLYGMFGAQKLPYKEVTVTVLPIYSPGATCPLLLCIL